MLVLIPLIAALFTQLVKFSIRAARGELRWSILKEYGGMPSGHTAFVISLDTVVWLHEGWQSITFAIAAIFSLIIIRDAIGLRQFLGEHGRILNLLIKELPDDEERKFPSRIAERLGHTPLQALVGGLIGFGIAYGLYQWWY